MVLPSARHVAEQRPVEPGEAAFASLAGRQRGDADARFVGSQQNKSGPADVMDGQSAGRTINQTLLAREIQRINRARRSRRNRRKPDFFAVRSPGESFDTRVKRRAGFAISLRIDDHDAAIVATGHVIGDGEASPPGENRTWLTQPCGS